MEIEKQKQKQKVGKIQIGKSSFDKEHGPLLIVYMSRAPKVLRTYNWPAGMADVILLLS